MTATYYAGDVGVEILIGPVDTGPVDGSEITSARVVATSPQNATVELAATIAAQAVDSITVRHMTDGSINVPDTWTLRVWLYVGASVVLSTLELSLPVTRRRVAPPT